ncbi:MAG: hypothetical protein ACR2RF_01060, partial [Geminicoccaceae bacterium]
CPSVMPSPRAFLGRGSRLRGAHRHRRLGLEALNREAHPAFVLSPCPSRWMPVTERGCGDVGAWP